MDFETFYSFGNSTYAPLYEPSKAVSAACLRGNRVGDAVKEKVRVHLHMTHTSDFIHGLAHKCLKYLDDFGDILHSANLEQIYPTTPEYTGEIETLDEAFVIFGEALIEMKNALYAFIEAADERANKAMAIKAEDILEDVDDDFAKLIAAANQWHCDGSEMSFDKWVAAYFKTEDD